MLFRDECCQSIASIHNLNIVKLSVIISGFFSYGNVYALPQDAAVAAGNLDVKQNNTQMNIQQHSTKAIVNWSAFDIQKNETLNISQPNNQSVLLNRVIGSKTSQIYGKLNANGKVFLVNPNGVTFSSSAKVNVGSLVASTLDIKDSDFLNGNYQFEAGKGTTSGKILNQGSINANTIALLGNRVVNEGWLVASSNALNATPSVVMAAGDKLSVSFGANQELAVEIQKGTYDALVSNEQLIRADGGQILLRAEAADALIGAAVNNTGIIEAMGIAHKEGKVVLLADMRSGTTSVDGTIDVSAKQAGVGNGGFIDTSAAQVNIQTTAKITASGKGGKNGLWLVDPNDLLIDDTNIGVFNTSLNNGTNLTLSTVTDGNVGSGNGDIFVNSSLSWNHDNTILTLQAQRNIEINAPIISTGDDSGVALYTELSYNSGSGLWDKVFDDTTWSSTNNIQYGDQGKIILTGSDSLYLQDGKSFEVINGENSVIGSASSESIIAELESISAHGNNQNYALGNDVQGLGYDFDSISVNSVKFDGLNNTVHDLTINTPTVIGVGLFSSLDNGVSMIKNTHIEEGSITAHRRAGAFVGSSATNAENYLYNLTNSADITGVTTSSAASFYIGGITGHSNSSTLKIEKSTNYGYISIDDSNGMHGNAVGGIMGVVGHSVNAEFIDVHNKGNVEGNDFVGGIIGRIIGAGTDVSKATNAGEVTGVLRTGGVAGSALGDAGMINISQSYSTGNILSTSGTSPTGGLLGVARYVTLSDSYATGDVKSDTTAGGLIGLGEGVIVNQSYYTGQVSHLDGSVSTGSDYLGALIGDINDYGVQLTNLSDLYWNSQNTANGIGGSSSGDSIDTSEILGLNDAQTKQQTSFTGFNFASSCGAAGTWCIQEGKTIPGLTNLREIKYVNINALSNSNQEYDATQKSSMFTHNSSDVTNSALVFNTVNATVQTTDTVVGSYNTENLNLIGFDSAQYDIQLSNNNSLSITPKSVSVNVIANDKVYDGNNTLTNYILNSNDFITGDNVSIDSSSVIAAFSDKNVGTNKTVSLSNIDLQGSDKTNYTLSSSSVISNASITKALLNLALKNASKTYDAQVFNGGNGYSISGFVAGEGTSDLSGTFNYIGDAQGAVLPGTYSIGGEGFNALNYDITFTPGALTIATSTSNSVRKLRTSNQSTIDCATSVKGCISDGQSIVSTYLENNLDNPRLDIPLDSNDIEIINGGIRIN